MSDLRPQHRDDARAGPGDRLFALHGEPLPRGARSRADASATPSSGPLPRAARRSPSAGWRSRSACRGLLLFEAPALRSIGLGGSIVVFCSVFYALTFLPAVLGMLGHRVNALSFQGLRPSAPSVAGSAAPPRPSRWEGVAHWVMRRPLLVLIPTLAFLLVLGTPFLRLQQGVPGAEIYPAGLESRDAYVALQTEFPRGETTPIVGPRRRRRVARPSAPTPCALAQYARRARRRSTGSIGSRVRSRLTDPATGAAMSPEAIAQLWSDTARAAPAEIAAGLDRLAAAYIRGSTVRLDAISPIDASQPSGERDDPGRPGRSTPATASSTQVGGTAALGHDFLVSPGRAGAVRPSAIPLVASAVILFLLFGSVVLPIKAVLMTLLSITASFGALVWIFQEGNLSEQSSRSTPLGFTIAGNPIIMFCVLFGLSMDYEVLLLSRIQEAYRRTGDNTASVAEGLAKTAGMITGRRGRDDQRLRRVRARRGRSRSRASASGWRSRSSSTRRSSASSSSRRRCGSWAAGTGGHPGPLATVRRSARLQSRRGRSDEAGARPIGDPSTGLARP